MADEDDLSIELDDTPTDTLKIETDDDLPEGKPESQAIDKGSEPSDAETAAQAAADLRRQLDEERAARREEARRRAEAEDQVRTARHAADDGQYGQIVNALEHRKIALDQAQAALSKAVQDGDGDTAAKAQVAIANLVGDIRDLEGGKRELETRRPRTEGRVEPAPEPRRSADPVEQFLESVPDPDAKAWLRRHPDCITDRRLNAKMLAAHHDAVADDIEIGSPSYYARLEQRLGFAAPPKEERPILKPEPRATPAAPAARDMSSGGERMTVRLSRAEQEAAEIAGISLQEYARNKMALIKAGELKV